MAKFFEKCHFSLRNTAMDKNISEIFNWMTGFCMNFIYVSKYPNKETSTGDISKRYIHIL